MAEAEAEAEAEAAAKAVAEAEAKAEAEAGRLGLRLSPGESGMESGEGPKGKVKQTVF